MTMIQVERSLLVSVFILGQMLLCIKYDSHFYSWVVYGCVQIGGQHYNSSGSD